MSGDNYLKIKLQYAAGDYRLKKTKNSKIEERKTDILNNIFLIR